MFFRKFKENLPLLTCVLVGLGLSLWPYFSYLFRGVGLLWIADYDELKLYLPIIANSYFDHPWKLGDPVIEEFKSFLFYPWIQFIPLVGVLKALQLHPIWAGFFWRVWAGITIPTLWYFIFKHIFKRPIIIFAATILIISDCGLLYTRPLLNHLMAFFQVITEHGDTLFTAKPNIHSEWRIITPGVSLVFLLAFILTMYRAILDSKSKNVLLAGFTFSLLFYSYFFFWTGVGFALVLALFLDRERWKLYFKVGVVGTVLGCPNIIMASLFKNSYSKDWLMRTDHFLPIDHFSELLIPKAPLIAMVILLFAFWKKRVELRFFLILGISGIIMTNHQIFSGLQIQNFHYSYLRGPVITLLIYILGFGYLEKRFDLINGKIKILMGLLLVAFVSSAFYLREQEISRSHDSTQITKDHLHLNDLKLSLNDLKQNAVVAGDPNLVYLATIYFNLRPLENYLVDFSPSVTNSEWHRRVALNSILSGDSLDQFSKMQHDYSFKYLSWGPWVRSLAGREEFFKERISAYDEVSQAKMDSIKQFRVHYLIVENNKLIDEKLFQKKYSNQFLTVWEFKNN